jgi:hypothetical protein
MHLLIFIVLAATIAMTALFSGCGNTSNTTTVDPITGVQPDVIRDKLSREAIKERLKKLVNDPRPKTLSPGAMCYKMAGPPLSIDYVCPVCNTKTIHKRSQNDFAHDTATWVLSRDLTGCRRGAKGLRGLNVRLDESEFCQKCKTDAKEPKLVLVVNHDGEKEEHRCRGVAAFDFRILQAFAEGKQKFRGMRGQEIAIKDKIKRLRQLLGIKE